MLPSIQDFQFPLHNAHQNSMPGSTNDAFAVASPGAALDRDLFVVAVCKLALHVDCLPFVGGRDLKQLRGSIQRGCERRMSSESNAVVTQQHAGDINNYRSLLKS